MEEKEIVLDGKNIKITTKLPKEEKEDNNLKSFLDSTIDLTKVVEEINANDEK